MRTALVTCLCPLAFAFAGEAVPEPAPRPPAPGPAFDPAALHLKAGRECFRKKEYAAAFEKFSLALAVKPAHREARFLAGLAAYWARRPEQALGFWNALLDSAPRQSAEEWRLETHRVMALAALDQSEAAEQVVARLYELRRKVPEAGKAAGFVREHFQIGAFRLGCWEVFDEKHEAGELWSFPVVSLELADEPPVACFAVAAVLLPGGKPGFVFSEESPGCVRIHKRWTQRPPYHDARAVLLDVLLGKAPPLEENKADNAATFSEAAARVVLPWRALAGREREGAGAPLAAARGPAAPPANPKARVFSEAEEKLAAKVQALGLDPAAAHILTVASRLRDVDFDVTRLTRLSLTDGLLAERCLGDLRAKAPFAPEDAAQLVDLISKANAEHVSAACGKLSRLGPRRPYLDYALLTAFTTRGRDVPKVYLKELLKSADFMVRQTAALLLARSGDQRGLAQLFKELESADALGGAILQGSVEELVGPVLGGPPAARAAAAGAGLNEQEEQAFKAWQQKAAQWWRENGGKLKFADGQWAVPDHKAR